VGEKGQVQARSQETIPTFGVSSRYESTYKPLCSDNSKNELPDRFRRIDSRTSTLSACEGCTLRETCCQIAHWPVEDSWDEWAIV
jgi:hypothetical protein